MTLLAFSSLTLFVSLTSQIKEEDMGIKLNSVKELRSKSDEDLIEIHNSSIRHNSESPLTIREELHRREASRINRSIKRLTWLIAILTVVNTVFVIFSALK